MTRVLVVDDEQTYCDSLGALLTAEGFDVKTARTADSALETGRRFIPDLLVADWMLGGELSGLDVARALQVEAPDLRTILITGYLESDLARQSHSDEIIHVLEKPFELQDFLACVRASL